MRVADLGCGVGMVTTLLAELVGPSGHVVGVDASGEQVARARELMSPGVSKVSFIEASASDMRLSPESFDLGMSRRLLN
jgi:ubiquinone/menaquinone biosynthesis C-methylase UbiE